MQGRDWDIARRLESTLAHIRLCRCSPLLRSLRQGLEPARERQRERQPLLTQCHQSSGLKPRLVQGRVRKVAREVAQALHRRCLLLSCHTCPGLGPAEARSKAREPRATAFPCSSSAYVILLVFCLLVAEGSLYRQEVSLMETFQEVAKHQQKIRDIPG